MKQSQATATTKEATSQMKTMLTVMTIFIGFASLSLPTAIALYWIVTYAFIIIQTLIMNMFNKNGISKKGKKEAKKIKEKLEMKAGMKYGKNK